MGVAPFRLSVPAATLHRGTDISEGCHNLSVPTQTPVNGYVSHWFDGLPSARAPLPGSRDADVCIVGAGYTGLWTAYYLKRADPSLRIVVLEARFAGFGVNRSRFKGCRCG
jgi:hypothetical protein